jgi:hypothetical protein
MFGLSKEERLIEEIDFFIGEQIAKALEIGESDALNARLNTPYTRGYILTLVERFSDLKGLDGDAFLDRNMLRILNTVTPRKQLLEIIISQGARVDLAANSDNPALKACIGNFEQGVTEGDFDAVRLARLGNNFPFDDHNLFRYLINQEEVYDDLPIDSELELPENYEDLENADSTNIEIPKAAKLEEAKVVANPATLSNDYIEDKLRFIKDLLNKNLITEEQANKRRSEIIDEI